MVLLAFEKESTPFLEGVCKQEVTKVISLVKNDTLPSVSRPVKPKYWKRQTWTNRVDTDDTMLGETFHQGLY